MCRSTTGAPGWWPTRTSVAPSATQIVSRLEWFMKSCFEPSLPCTYPGMTSAARSFLPTEPATVRLASVNGTRTDAPIPIARLNRLSNNPAVRTRMTLAQPQPPRLRALYRGGLLGSWLTGSCTVVDRNEAGHVDGACQGGGRCTTGASSWGSIRTRSGAAHMGELRCASTCGFPWVGSVAVELNVSSARLM